MTATHQIPATRNEGWGFYGTLGEHAAEAWPLAIRAISDATGQPPQSARAFLDSRIGRHFADEVLNYRHAGHDLAKAIEAATRKWMTWTIGRRTSRDYGIPRGLPYLTGFVIHAEIVTDD